VSSSSQPFASVLVCTRNRSEPLAETCDAILDLDYADDRWELVIVDNNSTDDTLQVARSIEMRNVGRVRVIQEAEIGLSAARNCAIREARGDFLAFIDDDAHPEPGWLGALVGALRQEGVLAAGGPVIPVIQGNLPNWFLGRYLPYLSVWDRGTESLSLTYNEYPRGANIAFRREAFDRFGLFSTQLGRKGRTLLSGEEIELCLRIERGEGKVLYVPPARVRHLTPADRITPRWMAGRFEAQGRSEAIINWRHAGVRGLAIGLRLHLRNAIGVVVERRQSEYGQTYARCVWRTLRGYLRGAFRCPISVPRYRTSESAEHIADWRP